MKAIDLSGSKRIPIYLDMAREMGQAEDPDHTLEAFTRALGRGHGWRMYVHLSCINLPVGHYHLLRYRDEEGVEHVSRGDLGAIDANQKAYTDGLLGDIIKTPEPKLFHNLKIADDPVVGNHFAGYGSAMAVPMVYNPEGTQWIVIFDESNDALSVLDVEELLIQSNMVGVNISTLYMGRELREATKHIEREVDEIAAIQRSLLPRAMPEIPGLDMAAGYETFDRAGGDYYDFLPLAQTAQGHDPNGPWAMIIADATGHGPAAAVVVAMLHALFHSYDRAPEGPVELVEHLNANLQSNRIRHSFVTAFLCIYDPPSRRLRYVRAGHDAPLLMRAGHPEDLRRLDDVNGFPLGVRDRVDSGEGCIDLEPGETLVLYTDGITEARSPAGEMFQLDGIERALEECNGEPDCVVMNIQDALKTHEAGVRASDDQAIVALYVNGKDG